MTMQNHLFVVFTNSVQGTDAEFNQWYNQHHQHEVVAVRGIRSCQRFALSNVQFPLAPKWPWQYLALYEIETDNPAACMQALTDAISTGVVSMSDTMDPDIASWVFQPIHPRISSS